MKKKQYMKWSIGLILAGLILTGCEEEPPVVKTLNPEPIQTIVTSKVPTVQAAPEKVPEIRLLCSTGNMSVEREAEAMELIQDLYRNMEVEEYLGECIHMASNEAWYDVLLDNMIEGTRTYTLEKQGVPVFSLQVGYTLNGDFYSNICYKQKEKMILLKQEGAVTQLTKAEIKDNIFNGDYEMWKIDGSTGDILKETGTFSEGIKVGDYTVSVKKGAGEADPFDLWTMREEITFKSEVTHYNEKGEVVVPEPEQKPADQKPTEQKPATQPNKPASPTPAPQPTPTPNPTPQPTPTPDPTPQPTPTPNPTPQPTPTPTPDPAPQPEPVPPPESTPSQPDNTPSDPAPGGNDSYKEWSDDLLD